MNIFKEKIRNIKKNRYSLYFILFIIAYLFVFPIYMFKGLWASFDTPFHVTMIAQFHDALKQSYFPVVWTQGVANYGLPFGLIAHPMTSYIGGLITIITKNPIISYKLLWLLFSFISVIGMYRLLRRFFGVYPAIAGVILYTFSAYRILNLYIRGALPEFAGAAMLAFLLDTLFDSLTNKNRLQIFLKISFCFILILFIHPMFLIFSGLITFLFFLYYHRNLIMWGGMVFAVALAIGVNSFYLIPLKLELKYFYMGQTTNMLVNESGLTFRQIFTEKWEYTCSNGDTSELRCNRIQTGLFEIALFLSGSIFYLLKRKTKNYTLLGFLTILGTASLILTLREFEFVYEKIPSLGSIQFPYRFLNVWLLVPPIILAMFLDSQKVYKKQIIFCAIFIIIAIRLPQIYTKNEYNPPLDRYYHNIDNIHSVMMNSIWMDESKNYPVKKNKIEILQGNGAIESVSIHPIRHSATITGSEELLIADYTFFFPGWHAYIDGVEVPIQFQDPTYRGFMTIKIPQGTNKVLFQFEDTALRLGSKLVSIASLLVFFGILYIYKFTPKWLKKVKFFEDISI